MKHFKGLTKLCFLNLDATQVSDVGLEHLKGLTNLVTLNLGHSKISDVGMQYLQAYISHMGRA